MLLPAQSGRQVILMPGPPVSMGTMLLAEVAMGCSRCREAMPGMLACSASNRNA